jgi:hypothetical protein
MEEVAMDEQLDRREQTNDPKKTLEFTGEATTLGDSNDTTTPGATSMGGAGGGTAGSTTGNEATSGSITDTGTVLGDNDGSTGGT